MRPNSRLPPALRNVNRWLYLPDTTAEYTVEQMRAGLGIRTTTALMVAAAAGLGRIFVALCCRSSALYYEVSHGEVDTEVSHEVDTESPKEI